MADLPADIHLHSKLCGHATGELREYVERAIALGLEAVGFAFHLPVAIPHDGKVNVTRQELDRLAREVERLQDAYAPDIPVRFGGEADFLPGSEDEVAALAAAYPFDHLIGSVHFIDRWAFDHPAETAAYEEWDRRELYERYFALVCQAARSGLFDIVGHIDLVKKFGHRLEGDWSDLRDGVCETIRWADLCVEINTAGFDKPAGEQYASEAIVRRLAEVGVPICFGSDAHAPGEVGRYFDRAAALARSAGHTAYAAFRGRARTLRPL
ncbi:MAG: histidinol-phosphatase HisJ family protein [Planctomycetota bacterium]